jgi:putative PIN family toxin of toxin-antitoxin system
MKPFQVVLDTSVLVAAVRSSQGASFRILQLIGDPHWELNLSPALLFEYEEVATIHAKKFWPEPGRLNDLLDFLIANSNRPKISYSWRPILRDADDDMIFELAVAARANFIVTHNIRDFAGAEQFGIGVLTPAEFLRKLESKT